MPVTKPCVLWKDLAGFVVKNNIYQSRFVKHETSMFLNKIFLS